MLRNIIIVVICLSMIIPNTAMDVQAEEYETKFLSIRRMNDEIGRASCRERV